MAMHRAPPAANDLVGMDALLKYGVAVFPLPPEFMLHAGIKQIISDMPELIDPIRAQAELSKKLDRVNYHAQVVIGGFGAAGTPSLTHHPLVRDIRWKVHSVMAKEFARPYRGRRLEVLFDRFGIRRFGTEVSAELWHRDVCESMFRKKGDSIYGGWVNLDPPGKEPQRFSCVPGNIITANQLDAKSQDLRGFSKCHEDQHPALKAAFEATGAIPVPPGHIIVFDQTIAHCISGGKAQFTSYRLYFGWRITDHAKPLYDKDAIIQNQSMFPLPSGQDPPMYAANHWLYPTKRDPLVRFSETFKPEFRESAPFTKKGEENTKVGIVLHDCPSLVATGHAFAPYTPSDRAMFFPTLL